MTRLVLAPATCALALLALVPPPASRAAAEPAPASAPAPQAQGPWLHLRVQDGNGQEAVNVNLPISIVSLAIQSGGVQADISEELSARGLTLPELRKTWADLRGANDADIVVTEDEKQSVRVRVESGNVVVHVTDRGDRDDVTTAMLPGRVVDALLQGEGTTLDLGAAIRSLASAGTGDLLTATTGASESVRIWLE